MLLRSFWLKDTLHFTIECHIAEDGDSIDIARKYQRTHELQCRQGEIDHAIRKQLAYFLWSYYQHRDISSPRWYTLLDWQQDYPVSRRSHHSVANHLHSWLEKRWSLTEGRMMPVHNVSYISQDSVSRVNLLSAEILYKWTSPLLHRPSYGSMEEQ